MKKWAKATPENVRKAFERLSREYPSDRTELTYEGPFQLIIAVILSAQCTDARVNMTTPALFAKYPDALKLAAAAQEDVEKLVKSCGFYRMKAKAIIATARDIVDKFKGEVPRTMEELVSLRGVGRKTASVVMNQAFDLPAIAVDTHVKRVSHRLGWARHPAPEKIEFELRELIPMELWGSVNGLLILHGRRICKARKPLCEECSVRDLCEFYAKHGGKLPAPARAKAPRKAAARARA